MKLALAAALAVCIAAPAFGQGRICVPREDALEMLKNGFGETRQSAGLTASGILETYANEETGTFTVILTDVNGEACVIASGTDWRKAKPEPEGVKL